MPLERALPAGAAHLCVDMQNLFAEDTPWRTPWMARVLPNVVSLTRARPERTIFTRFVPAHDVCEAQGSWRRYWEKWSDLTLRRIDRRLIELVPPLAAFSPPAQIVDKRFNSPWFHTDLEERLRRLDCAAIIVSGAETDVCVLSAVLGAVDRGIRVVIATDAICSSSDDTHDALIEVYHKRYSQQIETATVDEILEAWERSGL